MEVYFGGAFQGKLDYVLKKKGNLKVADGRDCDEKRLQSADVDGICKNSTEEYDRILTEKSIDKIFY